MRRHPPYHLRLNKAVDRLTLIRSIGKLEALGESLKEYTYYGLGGPYLEDYRLMYDFHPEIHLVSFEEDSETFKRQEFHRPCGIDTLDLRLDRFDTSAIPSDNKSICWLDYTGNSAENVSDFATIVGTVPANSIIKITLCAERHKVNKNFKVFCDKYKDYLHQTTEEPLTDSKLAELFQSILRSAILKCLPPEMDNMFQPISSHYYIDGGPMVFTLAGILCLKTDVDKTKRIFSGLSFSNLDWAPPKVIDLPFLSTKERLHLQKNLPCMAGASACLSKDLGYLTDGEASAEKMQQYAEFHRFFPYFMKATP